MPARLVALDGGPDILIDQDMVVVGRHPSCDARLDSLRLSRHHCCLTQEHGEISVRDLGSTNGIQINGERVRSRSATAGRRAVHRYFRYRVDQGPGYRDRPASPTSDSAHLPIQPIPIYQPESTGPDHANSPSSVHRREPTTRVPRPTSRLPLVVRTVNVRSSAHGHVLMFLTREQPRGQPGATARAAIWTHNLGSRRIVLIKRGEH